MDLEEFVRQTVTRLMIPIHGIAPSGTGDCITRNRMCEVAGEIDLKMDPEMPHPRQSSSVVQCEMPFG